MKIVVILQNLYYNTRKNSQKGVQTMKQWKKSAVLAVPMALLCSVSAFAGQWEEEDVTWKYLQDDGSYEQTSGSGLTVMETDLQSVITLTKMDGWI